MRPVLIVVTAFAVVTALLAWSRWLAGRRWAAAGHLLLACTATVAGTASWPLSAYVKRFEPQVAAVPLAELSFEQTGTNRYRATLTRLPSGQMQVVELTGNRWRLELQLLDWSARVHPLGPRPRYRIERLASRSGDLAPATDEQVIEHDLSDPTGPPPRLARIATSPGVPLLTVREASSPWQTMGNAARFEVLLSAEGTVDVVPRNRAAAVASGSPPIE